MSGKEYRICASDTPSLLASEVTELLSQGWELYGPPFANSDSPICQAMVKASTNGHAVTRTAPAPAPKKAPSQRVQPPRPTRPAVAATRRNVATFLAVALGGALLGDALVFRSGFYTQYLEPLSSTGTYERMFYAEANRRPSGKKEVLVMGNSRVAEGFSAKIANDSKQDGYWFLNCSVPATGARAFYYFLRDVDPHRDRYAAIAIPLDDYDDPDSIEDPADEVSEMWLVIGRLRIADILPYTWSFHSWNSRFDVFFGTTLKGLAYQRDFQDFIEHAAARLKSARDYRQYGSDWLYAYGGNERSLAGISVDRANHQATFPPGMPQDLQDDLRRQIFLEPPQHGWTRAFEIRWLGALADLYRGSKTRIILYQLPRNAAPRPTPLAHGTSTSVNELGKRSEVTVVDRTVFEALEKPELFFDYIHLNSAGRQLFSPLLAETVKARLR